MSLRSAVNAEVPVAAPGEFRPLRLGPGAGGSRAPAEGGGRAPAESGGRAPAEGGSRAPAAARDARSSDGISLWPPVVLAPMAGVTNPPFRTLCRRQGAGLYVAEMLHAQGLARGGAANLQRMAFDPEETIRSIQIFGADPQAMGDAARFLVQEVGVQHLDVNMGCPVRKVTARGGGSALPARPALMRAVLAATVAGAGGVPVTVKARLGLDEGQFTWRDTLAVAEGEGARWLGVHARTAAQLYSGSARWEVLGEIKAAAAIPVLGNGDIWEAFDALRLMRQTGCDGVIIGRGCLGRPWLFGELAAVFDGREPPDPPCLGDVLHLLHEHARLLVDFFGETKGVLELRKWCAWYTKGFPGSSEVRMGLQRIETLEQMTAWLARLDQAAPFPAEALRAPRAKRGGSQEHVSLPPGWLDLGARERIEERARVQTAGVESACAVAAPCDAAHEALREPPRGVLHEATHESPHDAPRRARVVDCAG